MYEENVKELIIALANDAAEEYRELIEASKHVISRKEKYYIKLRAEETLNFFDSRLFILAFGSERGKYIKEQLKKEVNQ